MPLKENEQAPDFTLPSTSGRNFTLSIQAPGKPCIIYFFPKAFTQGCTKEACEFRDSFDFFKNVEVPVYGISRDDTNTLLEFKQAYQLPYELLADEQGEVAGKYKATMPLINFTKRVTYLLDKDHKIMATYENLFGAKKHIQQMIEKLKAQSANGTFR